MISVTVGLGHDPTMAFIAPLLDQCTPDSELLCATAGQIPHLAAIIITHQGILTAITFLTKHMNTSYT
jgi:hypothetical protein